MHYFQATDQAAKLLLLGKGHAIFSSFKEEVRFVDESLKHMTMPLDEQEA